VTPRPVWLNGIDAATYAGIKPASLRVWKMRHGLTTHRVAGVTYYRLDELAAVLERRV
jgi:hypothetical protein